MGCPVKYTPEGGRINVKLARDGGTIVFDVENDRFGMVGYRIAPWLWNTGICTEAMCRVVEFIFSETQLDRLQGNADVRNIGSNRVLKKSGFTLEGTIRHGKMVSRYCDYNIWGMIREDVVRNKVGDLQDAGIF